jgi:hypothetical protein
MGQYHNYGGLLPQFTDPLPQDINQEIGVAALGICPAAPDFCQAAPEILKKYIASCSELLPR